jgi:hypothetical protein
MQVLNPPQKFECPPFGTDGRYGIKKYDAEVTLNGLTSLLNFVKIYQLLRKLFWGVYRRLVYKMVTSKPNFSLWKVG